MSYFIYKANKNCYATTLRQTIINIKYNSCDLFSVHLCPFVFVFNITGILKR